MIRQFGFTWTAISWLLMGYGLFFALSPLQAQTAIKKFSLELKNESLPEALKQLEKAGGKNILFTYNGTESYRVTVSFDNVHLVIGKKTTYTGNQVYVVKADGLDNFFFLVFCRSCYVDVGYIFVGQKGVECIVNASFLVFFGF